MSIPDIYTINEISLLDKDSERYFVDLSTYNQLTARLEAAEKEREDWKLRFYEAENNRLLATSNLRDQKILEAQIEALTKKIVTEDACYWKDRYDNILEAANKQIEALKADAEQYRWLREHDATGLKIFQNCRTPIEIDAAIDAARKGVKS